MTDFPDVPRQYYCGGCQFRASTENPAVVEQFCPGGHLMAVQGQFKDVTTPGRGFAPEHNYATAGENNAVDAALKSVLGNADVTAGIQARIQRTEKKP
jgi:hypothetical protein